MGMTFFFKGFFEGIITFIDFFFFYKEKVKEGEKKNPCRLARREISMLLLFLFYNF